jgi:hypothetical protein
MLLSLILRKFRLISIIFIIGFISVECFSQKKNIGDTDLIKKEKITSNKAKKEIQSYYVFCANDIKINAEYMIQTEYRSVVRTNKRLWNIINFKLQNEYKNDYSLFLKEQKYELEEYKQKVSDEIFKRKVASLNQL